jgi:hypothetical protein
MKRIIFTLLVFLCWNTQAAAAIIGEPVLYKAGEFTMQGYLSYDDSIAGKRPGILVVHEWWGHNEYARERARMLAGLGYTALALDMYGDGKQADHPDDAGKFAAEVRQNMTWAAERFGAALEVLQSTPPLMRSVSLQSATASEAVLFLRWRARDLIWMQWSVFTVHWQQAIQQPPGWLKPEYSFATVPMTKWLPLNRSRLSSRK